MSSGVSHEMDALGLVQVVRYRCCAWLICETCQLRFAASSPQGRQAHVPGSCWYCQGPAHELLASGTGFKTLQI